MVYSYTTADNVQAELRATTDFSATSNPTLTSVNLWINNASDEINQTAGRVYGQTSYTETYDYNGEDILITKNAPIISITSVLYSTAPLGNANYALSATKTENTDYTTYLNEGEVEILSANWTPSTGNKRIQINYDAGFSIVPGTVEMLATKKVTKRVLDTLMSKDVNEKKSGKSVSVGSISIVKPADFGVKQYSTLNKDISSLEEDLIGGTSAYRLPMTRSR